MQQKDSTLGRRPWRRAPGRRAALAARYCVFGGLSTLTLKPGERSARFALLLAREDAFSSGLAALDSLNGNRS